MTTPSPVVAVNATTPAPATCKESLQVGQLTVGMTVQGTHGPAEITAIRDGKWRFSEKPQRAIWFRDVATGDETTGLYHPDAPLKGNWQAHQDKYLATLQGAS